MQNQTRKNLDQLLDESERFETQYEQLTSNKPGEPVDQRLIVEITEWLQYGAEQGRYIPPASAERRALRSMLERWGSRLRDRNVYVPGIDALAAFDPKAGLALTLACPYPGLDPYTQNDQRTFFGRRKIADSCVAHLDRPENRILLIIGASGSGKSSLALAGVLPVVAERHGEAWCYAPRFTPGAHPLQEMAEAVAAAIQQHAKAHEIFQQLTSDPASAWQQLATLCQDRPLMLFVDQFEELLTTVRDAGEQTTFAEILAAITEPTKAATGFSCHVLLTLRTDHLARFENNDGLKGLYARVVGEENQRHLSPIGFEDIKLAIKAPADAVGLRFIPTTLIDRLASQTAGLANGLPLLQYALRRLWDTRPRNSAGDPIDLITEDMVNSLPDVERALGAVADEIFRTFSTTQQQICERLLLELVVLDESFEEPLRRRRREKELVELLEVRFRASADIAKVIDDFVGAGLLRRFGERPDSRLEVAHEALLRHWSQIYRILTGAEVKERLHLVKQIGREASDWAAHGKSNDYLNLRGERLARAIAFTTDGWLAEAEAATYVGACREEEEVQRLKDEQVQQEKNRADEARQLASAAETARLQKETELALEQAALAKERTARAEEMAMHAAERERWGAKLFQRAAAAALIALVGVALLVFVLDARQRDSALSTMRLAEEQANPHAALAFMAAALRHDPSTWPLADKLLGNLARRAQISSQIFQHEAAVYSTAFSPDDKFIVTACADGIARVWDIEKGEEISKGILKHEKAVTHVEFSSDGRHVVTASLDGTAKVWAWRDAGAQPWVLGSNGGAPMNRARFSPNGELLVTASGGSAAVWDVGNRSNLGTLTFIDMSVQDVEFSPDGQLVVARSLDSTATVFEARNAEKTQRTLGTPGAPPFTTVHFSPSGEFIVTGAKDGSLSVWNIAQTAGSQYTEMERPARAGPEIVAADFSPDSRWLITADAAGTASLWGEANFATLIPIRTDVDGLVPTILDVKFRKPDTQSSAPTFVIGSREGTSRVYRIDAKGPEEVGPITSAPVTPITPTQRIANTTQVIPITPPLFHRDAVLASSFSHNGSTMATASLDATVRLWNLQPVSTAGPNATGTFNDEPPLSLGKAARALDLTPDGAKLAVASDDGLTLWERNPTWVKRPPLTSNLIDSVKFSRDGNWIIAVEHLAGEVGVRVFELAKGVPETIPIPRVLMGGGRDEAVIAALSSDAGWWAVGFTSGKVHVGRRGQGSSFECSHHTAIVSALEFSSDGSNLLTASYDDTSAIVNLAQTNSCSTRSRISNTAPVNNAAFSPDGEWVVTASQAGARVWNTDSGRLVLVLDQNKPIKDAAFDSDGMLIVTASVDEAKMWDARTGLQLRPALAAIETQRISWARFRPGGRQVITADLVEKDFEKPPNGQSPEDDPYIRPYAVSIEGESTREGSTIRGLPWLMRLGWSRWPNHEWKELSDLLEATAGLELEEETQRLLPIKDLPTERARFEERAKITDTSKASTIDGFAKTLLRPYAVTQRN